MYLLKGLFFCILLMSVTKVANNDLTTQKMSAFEIRDKHYSRISKKCDVDFIC